MRNPTGELLLQTPIGHPLIQHFACIYCKPVHVGYARLAQLRMATKLMHLMAAHYTPNDSFTANDAWFYKNKFGHAGTLHHAVSLQLIMCRNIKVTKQYYRTSLRIRYQAVKDAYKLGVKISVKINYK